MNAGIRLTLLAALLAATACSKKSSVVYIRAEPYREGLKDPNKVLVFRTMPRGWEVVAELYVESTHRQFGEPKVLERIRVEAAKAGGRGVLIERIGPHPNDERRGATGGAQLPSPRENAKSNEFILGDPWLISARGKAIRFVE